MTPCKTCKWAEWELTPTGRIKRGESGRCIHPVTVDEICEAIAEKTPRCQDVVVRHRVAIWPDYGTAEEDAICPLWEAK